MMNHTLEAAVTMSTSGSSDAAASDDGGVAGNSDGNLALQQAQRKLRDNNFDLANLPTARDGPIWGNFMSDPYGLTLQELSALKNFRCPDVPRGVLPRIESGDVYRATDQRIRAKFIISNVYRANRYVMEAELMVDSGTNTELKLPARKVRQLGLEIRGVQCCRGSTNDVCEVYIFSPVLVQATFIRGSEQEVIQADLVVKCDKNEYDRLGNVQPGSGGFATPNQPILGVATPDGATLRITTVQVTPTKHRPQNAPLQQAALGIDGMKKLRLSLNGERQQLEIEEDEVLDDH